MIEYQYNYDGEVFGAKDPEDQYFLRMYLSYLSQFKYDDLPHWTEEDIAFYNKRSFTVSKDSSREEIYNRLMASIKSSTALNPKIRNLFSTQTGWGFKEFNHWYSVV